VTRSTGQRADFAELITFVCVIALASDNPITNHIHI